MDRDTIRRMDPELYQEKLEKAVMDDVLQSTFFQVYSIFNIVD